MPSGSHGGSGGSHGGFSGGGSFGGSSFSRGSSSYGRRGPRGPRYIHFGRRTLIITTGRQSLISIFTFFLVVAFLFVLATGSALSQAKDHAKMIEEEYRYYCAMVHNAEKNEDFIVDATVKDVFYQDQYERYYMTYSFRADNGYECTGYTFSIYTLENLPMAGDEFKLAVNSTTVTSDTDSVPMDYVDTTLEDDGEYLYYKKQINKNTLLLVGIIVGMVALVGCIVAVVLTAKKKEEEKEQAKEQEEIAKEKAKYCEYCGTKIQEGDRTCTSCGSRLH